MSSPTVSVVMSVYNGAKDVPAAARSILEQTFTDFEFIAIDDASPGDNSAEVLEQLASQYSDSRLQIVRLPVNHGLAGALNHGIALARGRYIARQDQDDISNRTRLAKQVAFMETCPECALLGTRAEIWVGNTPTNRAHDHPTDNATLQFDLLFDNPFVHSSVLIRRSALDVVGDYTTDRGRQPPEDYELWSRIARRFTVANLPERLHVYRETPNSMSRVGPNPFLDKIVLISSENIAFHAGLDSPDQRCRDAAALVHAANHKISPETDIDGACCVVRSATERLVSLTGARHLDRRADHVIATLRHQFSNVRSASSQKKQRSALWRLGSAVPLPPRLKSWIKYRVKGY